MALPPFAQVIKSRDVEDPVNLWLHRPLAYGFVAVAYRTSLTPNQVTLAAMLVGVAAGICWAVGTPTLMVVGGALLWTSSILDGADGILARAKKLQSELGRALDGVSDMVVAAATVLPAFLHMLQRSHDPVQFVLAPVAVLTTLLQIYTYDFYKESYLNSQKPQWDGKTQALAEVRARLAEAEASRAPWLVRFAWGAYLTMLNWQVRTIGLTDPRALRHQQRFPVGAEPTRIYRKHNYGPMQLWALVSLCPHTYLMAIFGMLDRLDLYLWYRVVGSNLLFVVALAWQRIATGRTLGDLELAGLRPVALDEAAPIEQGPCAG